MRLTASVGNTVRGSNTSIPAPQTVQGASIPAPIGGWDAINPLAAMPPQNAVELINFFPQPGYVELRRGHITHCDLETGLPVETVIGYQGFDPTTNALFAVSDGDVYDATTSPAVLTSITGLGSSRIQHTMFNNGSVQVAWCCNGEDDPFYFDGSAWTVTTLTGTGYTPADIINVTPYRNRLWCTVKNTTKAVYLGVDAINGAGTVFDVGSRFPRGGYLQAIGAWSTDTQNGPNEFIAFISSYGDIATYLITDPSDATKIDFLGTSQIGSPIGRRCLCRIGSDLGIITIDGAIPLSRIINYDRAAIQNQAITANIRTAVTEAARRTGDQFGWQLISYPRNTMAILNVPIAENAQQQQYVMNTVTGAWAQFQGQNANCWEVWQDRAYFGDNDGLVRLADEAAGDEDRTLSASMRCAYNYLGSPGNIKQMEMILPLINIDSAFPTQPFIGVNMDFATDGMMEPIVFIDSATVALWSDPLTAVWDQSIWPGEVLSSQWASLNGVGRCASITMSVSVPWQANLLSPRSLKINSFNVLFDNGGYI